MSLLASSAAPAILLFAQGNPDFGQPNGNPAGAGAVLGALLCPLIVGGLVGIIMIVSLWKIFEKAGRPGWEAIIPIYNSYILTCEVAKKEILWFILQFVPFIGIIAAFVVIMEVARKFRKSDGFGVGLILLPFIFFPMLAFGDAKYDGKKAKKRVVEEEEDDADQEEDDRPRRGKR